MLTRRLDVNCFKISKVAKPKPKVFPIKSSYFYIGFVLSLLKHHCHFLDFKMYDIVERRLQPRRKAASYNTSESNTKFDSG